MDSKERERYNMREKAIYDEISALENAEKKGLEKGEKNKGIEVAKKALSNGLDIKTVVIITGLSEEEIKNLK